jgi:hypothetical protein
MFQDHYVVFKRDERLLFLILRGGPGNDCRRPGVHIEPACALPGNNSTDTVPLEAHVDET